MSSMSIVVSMAFYLSFKNLAFLSLALALCIQGTIGNIVCEHLEKDQCAFAVSSSGTRCVLEKSVRRSGEVLYTCKSSQIETDNLKDWIETDQCVKACGVDRYSLGISSDSLMEAQFTKKLCSPQCFDSCANIVDLYFNLAAGEGVFLPKLCESQKKNDRRVMAEIRSSGNVASGPISANVMAAPGPKSENLMAVPTVAPVPY